LSSDDLHKLSLAVIEKWSCLGLVDGIELGVEDIHHVENKTVSAGVPAADH
jgi:hypothetical protein